MKTSKQPVRHNARRNHETPLPRLTVPVLTPRAQIARGRALAILTRAGMSPFASYQNGPRGVF